MRKSKVAIVACESYDQDLVNSAVKEGISLLGGIDQFCRPNERLLLKPNALWGTDPEHCVVTHTAVFKAVALLFQGHGANLQYGDSPAGLQRAAQAMQKPGFAQVAADLNISFADFDQGRTVSFPEGIATKQLFIANAIFSCDGVISLPKLKTHGLTRMTGAIKNQYGCIPGITKGDYHARLPNVYDFSRLLVDITRFVKPRLYIMDGIYAMEGNGPQSGDPKKLGVLLFSTDPVALDATASRIINLCPDFVPPITEGVKAGLGVSSEDMIEVIGTQLKTIIDPEFNVVRSAPIPVPNNSLLRQIRSFFIERPVINTKKCIRCLRCVNTCPVDPKAIFCKNNRKTPQYDYRSCIRCYCCQEVCPVKAITIKVPLTRKLLPVASYLSLFLTNRHSKAQRKKKCQ